MQSRKTCPSGRNKGNNTVPNDSMQEFFLCVFASLLQAGFSDFA